jgi:hypothetical protein
MLHIGTVKDGRQPAENAAQLINAPETIRGVVLRRGAAIHIFLPGLVH